MNSPPGAMTPDLSGDRNLLLVDHNYVASQNTLDDESTSNPGPSTSRQAYGGSYCCVVDCHNSTYRNKNGSIKFHRFPVNLVRRGQWERAVRRSVPGQRFKLWRASKSAVICSEHFALGQKTDEPGSAGYVPTIFPTHGNQGQQTPSAKRRLERHKKFQKARDMDEYNEAAVSEQVSEPSSNSDTDDKTEEGSADREGEENMCTSTGTTTQTDYVDLADMGDLMDENDTLDPNNNSNNSDKSKQELIFLDYGIQAGLPPISLQVPMKIQAFYIGYVDNNTEKSTQIESIISSKVKTKVKNIQTDKQQVLPFENFTKRQFRAFTGVDKNFVEFMAYRTQSKLQKSRYLSRELKITLLLVKLKVNPTFAALAAMFGVCEDTVIKLFYETLDIVAEESRNNLVWFDRTTVQARMPNSFKEHYPDARATIDCTEIETEIPSDVRENVLTYSNYKSKHTLKVLIAVAPSGEITFISKAYGGRCTDTEITVGSGFLNLIEPGDVILADKGFPKIQTDVNKSGGILVMPPFKKGNKQFSEIQNKAGYHCSSVRIHVEHAIERLKRFESLTFVPASARKNVDKILQIVAFIANCYTDLINND